MTALVKAQAVALIDEAILYVEKHGFNVWNFTDYGRGCCYIGTLRTVDKQAKETMPDSLDGSMGGSSALKEALLVLDHLAMPLLRTYRKLETQLATRLKKQTSTGRYIEKYGFQVWEADGLKAGASKGSPKEVQEALHMLRKAKETLIEQLSEDKVEEPALAVA